MNNGFMGIKRSAAASPRNSNKLAASEDCPQCPKHPEIPGDGLGDAGSKLIVPR